MANTVFRLFNSKGAALAMCGILSMFGLAGSAKAECVTGEDDPSAYTLLIDASSSCSNLSGNMFGCEVDGSGSCTITHPTSGETIKVTLSNGSVGGTTPIDWSATSSRGGLVDLAIIVGANNGGSCGTTYTPGSSFGEGLIFRKTNGGNQKINALFFCSDFTQPPPDVPRLIVTKTVTTEDDDTCSESVDSLEIGAGESVRYCYTVENVGAGLAVDVTLSDDAGTPGNSGDDFDVALGLVDGNLSPGAPPATGMSLPVVISEPGTVVNTATAMATGFGGPVEATDTATVNAVQVAEICPPIYQNAVNELSLNTGQDFAFLGDPNDVSRRSICVPNGVGGAANTKRYKCIDQCVTKEICKTDPNNKACKPSACESSGAWTDWTSEDGIESTCSLIADPAPGATPYCWEVQQDLNRDCTLNEWEPQEESVLQIKKGHVNPYVWQTCYSSGGRYVCETMCYLFPGDTSGACPLNSTVF